MSRPAHSRAARAKQRLRIAAWSALCALGAMTLGGLAQAQTRTQIDQAVKPLEDTIADPASVVGEEALRHAREADAVAKKAREEYAASYEDIRTTGRTIVEEALQRQASISAGATSPEQPPQARTVMPDTGRGYRLFVSQSMPDADLEAAARLAAQDPRLVMVLRGFKPGQTLLQLSARIQSLAGAGDGAGFARIEIDPPAFIDAQISAAPTLAAYQDGKLLAKVQGVVRPQWLEDRLGPGRAGDLGTRGPTFPLIERDLMQLLQERVAQVQEENKDRGPQIFNAYFDTLRYRELPAATAARTRRIDPTVEVQQTLRAPDGTLIAEAGTRVNPLDHVPFPGRVFVFDATDDGQRAVVQQLITDAPDGAITLVSTRLSGDKPAEHFGRLQNEFGRRVTLLNDELVARFQLQRVPAVIHADATHYIVDEYAAPRMGIVPARED